MNKPKPKTIVIDIDGTVCTEEKTFERSLATPLPGAKEKVNALYEAGNMIVFWTARGWEQLRVTKEWLDQNGFKYHHLVMGKLIADVFIDDRGRQFKGWDIDYLGQP